MYTCVKSIFGAILIAFPTLFFQNFSSRVTLFSLELTNYANAPCLCLPFPALRLKAWVTTSPFHVGFGDPDTTPCFHGKHFTNEDIFPILIYFLGKEETVLILMFEGHIQVFEENSF